MTPADVITAHAEYLGLADEVEVVEHLHGVGMPRGPRRRAGRAVRAPAGGLRPRARRWRRGPARTAGRKAARIPCRRRPAPPRRGPRHPAPAHREWVRQAAASAKPAAISRPVMRASRGTWPQPGWPRGRTCYQGSDLDGTLQSLRMSSLALLLLTLALGAGQSAAPPAGPMRARLSPLPTDLAMQETIAGLGTATATLAGTTLTIEGTYQGLKSPATVVRVFDSPRPGMRGPLVGEFASGGGTTRHVQGHGDAHARAGRRPTRRGCSTCSSTARRPPMATCGDGSWPRRDDADAPPTPRIRMDRAGRGRPGRGARGHGQHRADGRCTRRRRAGASGAGIFTAAQAAAGRDAYQARCASCHLPSLGGSNEAAPLAGSVVHERVARALHAGALRLHPHVDAAGRRHARRRRVPEHHRVHPAGQRRARRRRRAHARDGRGHWLGGHGRASRRRQAQRGARRAVATTRRRRPARRSPPARGLYVSGEVPRFTPVTDQMLRTPPAGDWLMARRNYQAWSHSPLDEITTANVGSLQARLGVEHERGRRRTSRCRSCTTASSTSPTP